MKNDNHLDELLRDIAQIGQRIYGLKSGERLIADYTAFCQSAGFSRSRLENLADGLGNYASRIEALADEVRCIGILATAAARKCA